LPAGWAWPVNPQAIALGLSQEVYRPVNVQALQSLAGRGPCAPVEVAPSVWITPFCGKLPSLSFSPKASSPPAAAAANTPIASGVDLRALGLDGPVKDQQQAGVCWSFAISTLMDNALRRAGRSDVMAPLHIIADDEFQLLFDKGSGKPLVLESAWAYDPHKACKLDENSGDRSYCQQAYNIQSGSWKSDPTLVVERTRAESSGVYRIMTFHPLSHSPAKPDEIARVLATGQAVYVGFDIDTKSWSSARQGAGAVLPDWTPDGSGGHAVALVGYRTAGNARQFLVHNSWGKGWGDGGYAWVSETMVRDRIHEAFTVTVGDSNGALATPTPTPIPTPIPTPTPTPTPTPGPVATTGQFPFPLPFPAPGPASGGQASACPTNAVRDLLLGTCVAPCAGGVAPVAGICPVLSAPAAPNAASSACAAGSSHDVVTAVCEPTCPSGRPRAAGVCFF
jgi:C1A family cysteine protease